MTQLNLDHAFQKSQQSNFENNRRHLLTPDPVFFAGVRVSVQQNFSSFRFKETPKLSMEVYYRIFNISPIL